MARKTEEEREEEERERLEEIRERRRRATRGWQELLGLHNGGDYLTKDGEVRDRIRWVREKYHYNAGGTAFCGVSLYFAEEVPNKVLRRTKHRRCKKCLAGLRRAWI